MDNSNPFFKPAYTVDEFCAAHGIGRNLAYDEMKAGRLRFKKCGRKTLISSEYAADWLKALPDGSLNAEEELPADAAARIFIEGHPFSPPN